MFSSFLSVVIPARAEIHFARVPKSQWVPTFWGMTAWETISLPPEFR
jgi:hypothetical protein